MRIFKTENIKERMEDSGDFPKVVVIDTTNLCNLKCSMCAHKDMKRKKGIMGWDLFKKIVKEIADEDKGTRVWMVFFGEALILSKRSPTIFEMITYAKSQGLKDVVLNTNGVLLDEKAAEGLIRSGLDALYVGLDAVTQDTYAKMRVGGDHEKVVQNVLRLLQLRRLSGRTKPEVCVQFIETEENYTEKEDFVKFWGGTGAVVKVRPKISWAGLVPAPGLTLTNEERYPCYWVMRVMPITHTGEVALCGADLDARFIAGDVRTSSIKEVWTGKLKEIRNKHLARDFGNLPDFCSACKDWQSAKADFYAANAPVSDPKGKPGSRV